MGSHRTGAAEREAGHPMKLRNLKHHNVSALLATPRVYLRVHPDMTRQDAYRALRNMTKNGRIVWPKREAS